VNGARRTPIPSVIAAVLGLVQKSVLLYLVTVLVELEEGWVGRFFRRVIRDEPGRRSGFAQLL
jgi:hypothetical protein